MRKLAHAQARTHADMHACAQRAHARLHACTPGQVAENFVSEWFGLHRRDFPPRQPRRIAQAPRARLRPHRILQHAIPQVPKSSRSQSGGTQSPLTLAMAEKRKAERSICLATRVSLIKCEDPALAPLVCAPMLAQVRFFRACARMWYARQRECAADTFASACAC
jgi:hypothetical protein